MIRAVYHLIEDHHLLARDAAHHPRDACVTDKSIDDEVVLIDEMHNISEMPAIICGSQLVTFFADWSSSRVR